MFRPVPEIPERDRIHSPWGDLFILSIFLLFIYFFIGFAQRWTAPVEIYSEIDLSFLALPKYTFFSLIRASIAYLLSLCFSLVFGYLAARNKLAEKLILPMLDIGQSIPVLGFLPGLVMGLVALFPTRNLGLELACILLIFTGQVWNLTLGYYASLKSLPSQFHELSKLIGLGMFRKMVQIEIPFSTSVLAWNSLMSMAGGWFFLTICESFRLGTTSFRLPGLGAYMSVAIEQHNTRACMAGLVAMVLLIITIDFLFWRPILAWSQKFRLEEALDQTRSIPFVTLLLRESRLIRRIMVFLARRAEAIENAEPLTALSQLPNPAEIRRRFQRKVLTPFNEFLNEPWIQELATRVLYAALVCFLIFSIIYVYELVRPLAGPEWRLILFSMMWTLVRVVAALVISTLWTVPAGIWIGSSQRLTGIFQPLVQIMASFPAPMLYPLVLFALLWAKIPLEIGSVVLITLGVQWYILFNVLAGASTISPDLRQTLQLIGVNTPTLWRKLYLPSIFPSLVTGWMTAAGGAWNASIVAEYIDQNQQVRLGLGALISRATNDANYSLLSGCLIVMCATVIVLNRTFWRSLFDLADSRFRFDV